LCEDLEGYHNLIKLVSAGFVEGFYYKPRIDYDLLSKHSKGLIALSACLRGAVTEAVVEQKYDQARENAYRMRDVFGKANFFLEIQDQGLEIEKDVNRELVRLSKETGIPLVATNDCHYLHKEVAREGFAARVPYLERLAQQGFLRNPLAEYESRLTAEIEMIKKMRYEGYFLIVWDFIHYARAQNVPVGPGRGSAAGSLVSYAL